LENLFDVGANLLGVAIALVFGAAAVSGAYELIHVAGGSHSRSRSKPISMMLRFLVVF
jgi:hypothetical protein